MTSTEKPSTLQTRLIQGRGDAMEIGQVSAETSTDEPFWLKILCFVGAVFLEFAKIVSATGRSFAGLLCRFYLPDFGLLQLRSI